ncbi:hypothetical protein [Paenibacillus xylanexedens]|uniref:hypothetical protein n=1 Tax=Paenibacillus xylanexedens TaxID=528191 RepID=UPI0011A4890D|nr:hypothetical protein [Paenibacillus xylanexedens]
MFIRFEDQSTNAKRLTQEELEAKTAKGVNILFEIASEKGGYVLLEGMSEGMERSRLVCFYPAFSDHPIAYELELEPFYNWVINWITGVRVQTGLQPFPTDQPTPLENLAYCLDLMVDEVGLI